MLDLDGAATLNREPLTSRRATPLGDAWSEFGIVARGLVAHRLHDLESLVLTKSVAGFDDSCVDAVGQILRDVAAGRLGNIKFLVLDFAHPQAGDSVRGSGFDALVTDAANLILEVPVVSIGWARGFMTGADLEFALACSMLVGEQESRFAFGADPLASFQTYRFLAQRIGFARTEHLMEADEVLGVERMRDLLLVKEAAAQATGHAGIEEFVRRRARRHNSSCGIYRAQRIAMPVLPERAPERRPA